PNWRASPARRAGPATTWRAPAPRASCWAQDSRWACCSRTPRSGSAVAATTGTMPASRRWSTSAPPPRRRATSPVPTRSATSWPPRACCWKTPPPACAGAGAETRGSRDRHPRIPLPARTDPAGRAGRDPRGVRLLQRLVRALPVPDRPGPQVAGVPGGVEDRGAPPARLPVDGLDRARGRRRAVALPRRQRLDDRVGADLPRAAGVLRAHAGGDPGDRPRLRRRHRAVAAALAHAQQRAGRAAGFHPQRGRAQVVGANVIPANAGIQTSAKAKAPLQAGPPRSRNAAGSVAHLLLQVLPALLRIQGALGGQAGRQAVQADLLAGVHAVAVVAGVDPLERAVDLADQLAVAVAVVPSVPLLCLAWGALGLVTEVAHFVLEVLDGRLVLLDQVLAPLHELLAEVLELQRAHVLLFRVRTVALGQDRTAG